MREEYVPCYEPMYGLFSQFFNAINEGLVNVIAPKLYYQSTIVHFFVSCIGNHIRIDLKSIRTILLCGLFNLFSLFDHLFNFWLVYNRFYRLLSILEGDLSVFDLVMSSKPKEVLPA